MRLLEASLAAMVRTVRYLGTAVDSGLEPLSRELNRRERRDREEERLRSSVVRDIEELR